MPISGGSTAFQFSEYIYEGALAGGTYFIPPRGVIVMGAHLATPDLDLFFVGQRYLAGADMTANQKGWIGAVYHNGDPVHGHQWKNANVGAQNLKLTGLRASL